MNPFTFFLFLVTFVNIASVPAIAQEDGNQDQANGGCPFPLISLELTGLSETETSACLRDCCLPCPIANNFYRENQVDLIYNVLSVIRAISFVCVLILVISYLVLPNKREHPAITVLYLNVSILIFTGVTFFYIGDLRRVQCADLVTQATMKNNNLCSIQGIVLIFSTFLCILWCFLLILHLHLQTVWKSSIIQRNCTVPQTLVMVIAVTFTILPAAMGDISYKFGTVCFIAEFTNELFWYPLGIFVIPGFFMHFWTFIHIAKSQFSAYRNDDLTSVMSPLTNATGQELIRAIKIQWRALTLALVYLVTYTMYWTYYLIELEPKQMSKLEPWFLKWLNCILENGMKPVNAQNKCSIHAIDHVPNITYLAFAETSTAILGISVFIVFGTSTDLWSEWKLYFIKKFCDGSNNSQNSQDMMVQQTS